MWKDVYLCTVFTVNFSHSFSPCLSLSLSLSFFSQSPHFSISHPLSHTSPTTVPFLHLAFSPAYGWSAITLSLSHWLFIPSFLHSHSPSLPRHLSGLPYTVSLLPAHCSLLPGVCSSVSDSESVPTMSQSPKPKLCTHNRGSVNCPESVESPSTYLTLL